MVNDLCLLASPPTTLHKTGIKNPDTQEHQMSSTVSNSGGAKEKRLKSLLLELKKIIIFKFLPCARHCESAFSGWSSLLLTQIL